MGKAPSVYKAMYQGLDSRQPGSQWWSNVASSGPVLSGIQWQWDIYSGRHHELMNDNPEKVLTEADAWNGEDFYEDRSRDESSPMAWIPVPSALPSTKAVVDSSRYAVLVWRSGGDGSPTEVRLPDGYRSTIVSDVAYTVQSRNLVLSGAGAAGAVHFALIADSVAPSASVLAAARTELTDWATAAFPS